MKTNLMKLLSVCSLACSLNVHADYVDLSANDKQIVLWSKIEKSEYVRLPTKEPSVFSFGNLLNPFYLMETFTTQGDVLPRGHKKMIHPYGSVVKMQFNITQPNPYSGLFKTGTIGMARLSLAALRMPYTPGIALKFLVDGKNSANIIAMYSLDGQGNDKNYFANTFSNIIAPPKNGVLAFLAIPFAKTVRLLSPKGPASETNMPLFEMASVEKDGTDVTAPVVPYQLLLVPSAVAKTFVSSDSQEDLRQSLAAIPTGTVLYNVFVTASEGAPAEEIGEIVTTSPVIASQFGDEVLFFKHPMNVK